jgi:threonine/homoserine/homoserine lactone efflux protein
VPDAATLGVFFGAGFILLITPGPAVLYIVTRSIEQGRKAGLVSVLGIVVGTLFHVAAAALGVSALLMSSALAFNALRYLGAVYLVYLGCRTLVARDRPPDAQDVDRAGLTEIFSQGVVVNLLNPHTALFFFAFLPQFVDPARGSVAFQIVALGLLFIAMAAMTDSVWAITAGTAGDWIKRNPRFTRAQRYVTGGALIGLGAVAAISGSGRRIAK